jgi:hypothetical protein
MELAIRFFETAESAVFYIGPVPVSILDVFGSILSCMAYRNFLTERKLWAETLVSCTLLQFGGTTLTGVLLGQTPSWIMSHSAFPALLLVWWLIFFSPFDIFYRLLNSSKLLITCIKFGAAISSGHAVTSWGADKALWNTFHVNSERIKASLLTCILCGTLSGCGGGMLGDLFDLYYPAERKSMLVSKGLGFYRIRTSSVLANMSRSCLCAILYYSMINPSGYFYWGSDYFSKEVAHFYIISLQLLHVLVTSTDPAINIFEYFGKYILFLLQINIYVDGSNSNAEKLKKKE